MRFDLRILQSLAITLTTLLLVGAAMATTKTNSTKPSSTSHKSVTPSKSGKSSSSKSKKKKTSAKATSHGQHGIDQERTRQIQEALIRDHYMTGEPTGSWDQATKDALTRYQEANG